MSAPRSSYPGMRPLIIPVADRTVAGSTAAAQWAQIQTQAPQIAATMQHYLQRLAAFQAASSVDVAENSLRQFACWMITDARLDSVASVRRDEIEDFKVWLASKPHPCGGTISPEPEARAPSATLKSSICVRNLVMPKLYISDGYAPFACDACARPTTGPVAARRRVVASRQRLRVTLRE